MCSGSLYFLPKYIPTSRLETLEHPQLDAPLGDLIDTLVCGNECERHFQARQPTSCVLLGSVLLKLHVFLIAYDHPIPALPEENNLQVNSELQWRTRAKATIR